MLGTAGGGIDGGQWQLPMPQMINSGEITNGRRVPMFILAMLSSQGNGIVGSNSVKKADLGMNTKGDGKFFQEFETKNKRKFRAAYTFPKANQDMWIRYWLAASGVEPEKNVELLTLPAAWSLLESMRWKFYPAQLPSVAAAKALNDKVTREDLWKKAATELGVPAKEIPKGSSRGSERLFDGVVYDPTKPQAYLDSLKIKR